MIPITYLLYIEDDWIPLESSSTIGNHLENDIMVPGEDVADFHLRIEITDRGPVLVPLGSATFNINVLETNEPIRTIVGDVVTVGQSTMQIGFEVEMEGTHYEWFLVADSGEETPVIGEIAVGRASGADVTITDAHISRFHARFLERKGFIWIQDLGSANGTHVNAEKYRVACVCITAIESTLIVTAFNWLGVVAI
jgi:hypothetical protein